MLTEAEYNRVDSYDDILAATLSIWVPFWHCTAPFHAYTPRGKKFATPPNTINTPVARLTIRLYHCQRCSHATASIARESMVYAHKMSEKSMFAKILSGGGRQD